MSLEHKNLKPIIIAGPTATGKTSLALLIAKTIDGEIINSDSRQVYKYMNIGTNKGHISAANSGDNIALGDKVIQPHFLENSNINAWLFDLVEPGEYFSLASFLEYAQTSIKDIISRGKVPIIVGGTGLYIDSLLRDYALIDNSLDQELRESLENHSTEELQVLVQKQFPQVWDELNNSDKSNPRRLMRVIEKNGETNSINPLKNDWLMIYPKFDLTNLSLKIQARVVEMFTVGLVKEVRTLIDMGYENAEQLKGIGYKEVFDYFNDIITLPEAQSLISMHHRQYAKRQITWFTGARRGYKLNIFDFSTEHDLLIESITEYLNT